MRPLELLIHMRTVQNICMPQSIAQDRNLGRRMVQLTVIVPDLQDMKALLRADADTHNCIGRIRSRGVKNACGRIALEGLLRNALRHLDTVSAAMDVATMLPHRREGVAHKEIHTGQKVAGINRRKRTPELLEAAEGRNLVITGWRPVRVIRSVEVKRPRARREHRRRRKSGCHFLVRKERFGRLERCNFDTTLLCLCCQPINFFAATQFALRV